MLDTIERTEFVKHSEIITDTYNCKLCFASIKRDRMDIEAHLKEKHKTSLRLYSDSFESTDSVDQFNHVVKKLLKEGKIANVNLCLELDKEEKKIGNPALEKFMSKVEPEVVKILFINLLEGLKSPSYEV